MRIPLAVATGGALGAVARHGVQLAWPAPPWVTLAVNAVGCLLIGVLMARTTDPLRRAFLGVGVLGGFTTFSTYTLDAYTLIRSGHPALAAAYLGGTAAICVAATFVGTRLARPRLARPRLARSR
jgi:CrcB protein